MNRFLTDILPKGIVEAQEKRNRLEREKWDIGRQLEYDDNWANHDCDCEFCESRDYDSMKALGIIERQKLDDRFKEIDLEIVQTDRDIKQMTSYKDFMERRTRSHE